MVSQRVAPRPTWPSRRDIGTDRMTSRLMAMTIGVIMIARTMPAVNTEKVDGRSGSSAKNGMTWPTVEAMYHCSVSRRNGAKMYSPHSPTTTLGIAAISSTMNVSTNDTRRGAYSTR